MTPEALQVSRESVRGANLEFGFLGAAGNEIGRQIFLFGEAKSLFGPEDIECRSPSVRGSGAGVKNADGSEPVLDGTPCAGIERMGEPLTIMLEKIAVVAGGGHSHVFQFQDPVYFP